MGPSTVELSRISEKLGLQVDAPMLEALTVATKPLPTREAKRLGAGALVAAGLMRPSLDGLVLTDAGADAARMVTREIVRLFLGT